MQFDWQNLAVLVAVLAAGGYLLRRACQTMARRKAAACGGGCGSCSLASEPVQLVGTDTLSQSAQALARSAAPVSNTMPVETTSPIGTSSR